MHDQILDQGDGYWIKFEAWRVDVSDSIPHGIRYSLTLHEPYGKRILGYDLVDFFAEVDRVLLEAKKP